MLDAALEEDLKASNAAPHDAYMQNNLGVTLARLGRTEEAIAHFRRAVEEEPLHPMMRRHLAFALWELGRERDAIDVLTELDHPLTKEAARLLGDYHLRALARKGAIAWSGGKPQGSKLGIKLTPGTPISQWIADSRR